MKQDIYKLKTDDLFYHILNLCQNNKLEEIKEIFSSDLLNEKKFGQQYNNFLFTAVNKEHIDLLDYFCSYPDKKIRKKFFIGPVINVLYAAYDSGKYKVVDYFKTKYPNEFKKEVKANSQNFLEIFTRNGEKEKFIDFFNAVEDKSVLNNEILLKSAIVEDNKEVFIFLLDNLEKEVFNHHILEQVLYTCLMSGKIEFVELALEKTTLDINQHLTDYTFVSVCINDVRNSLHYLLCDKDVVPKDSTIKKIETHLQDPIIDNYLREQLQESYNSLRSLIHKNKLEKELKYDKSTEKRNKL